jgi:23S rRNA pseudouridine1911/1915/1917 synthase
VPFQFLNFKSRKLFSLFSSRRFSCKILPMERILTYQITRGTAGQSILAFLKQKRYSHSVITQLKKTECGILINGIWAYTSHILKESDLLAIRLAEPCGTDAACPKALPFRVVYEDEDLLIADKPAGMPVHPSMGHLENTLANAAAFHAMQRRECYPFRCVNRLDRDTSGLAIIAKHAYSSCVLNQQMRERAIHRTYYAIAEGITEISGTIDAPIARKAPSVIERTVDFASGEPAVTHYERLACRNGLSFLKLWLETGRTHQIRVHMRYCGHPLIGDFLYHPNPGDSGMKRQALHAGNLTFYHPVTGQLQKAFAPLPEDMMQLFPMDIAQQP